MRYPRRRACHIFGRSRGGASRRAFFKENFVCTYGQYNLMKQNNNFSILKKVENPLVDR